MNKRELAQRFHVVLSTVDSWLVKGCPHKKLKNGSYQFDIKAVENWRIDAMPTRAATPSLSFSDARARKETALAGLRELQLKQREGEVVEVAAIERDWFVCTRTVRDNVENVPARLSGLIQSAAVTTLLAALSGLGLSQEQLVTIQGTVERTFTQHAVYELLRVELRQVLQELSEKGKDYEDTAATTTSS